jgi:hypothetical protein
MVSSQNPQPSSYGYKCGGHDAMSDAHNCRQQQNQQQTSMAKGGAGCKVTSPQSPGGVEVNSPHNNASNANGLTESLNQARENASYDKVGNRNVDNSSGPSGGSRKKRTKHRKHKKRLSKTRFTKKRRTSQKSRRRKVYIGCNRRTRNRMGGKTSKLSGWGCMSGGKRKIKKGGDFISGITKHIPGTSANKAKKLSENTNQNTGPNYRTLVNNPIKAQEFNKDWKNLQKDLSKEVQNDIDEDFGRTALTSEEYKPLTHEEKATFQKQDKGRNVSQFTSRKNKRITFGDSEYLNGGKRKTRKFKKHYMWNTRGKRYMAKTYKQHIRGSKLGHTHKNPKSKKNNKKKRKTRRGGNMTPGSREYELELRRRREARAKGLNVLENKAIRNSGVDLFKKTLAEMEQQNMNQRHSIGPGSEFNTQSSSLSRNRTYTRG